GIFDRRERCHFIIRSLTPQQATGNALAIAVHVAWDLERPLHNPFSLVRMSSKGYAKVSWTNGVAE
ncbi:MAG: hypothetical protein JW836_13895, partial [Deltaproteobacteria bacterium]|nr:hypothetical protein [Deltaproteobacteria bacterium]